LTLSINSTQQSHNITEGKHTNNSLLTNCEWGNADVLRWIFVISGQHCR